LLFAGELILGSPPSYLPLPVLETDFKDNWYGFLTGQMPFISSRKQYHNTAGVFKNQQKSTLKMKKTVCQQTSACSCRHRFTSPEHTICPRRDTAFFTGVKVVAEQIVLVRRYEIGWTFIKATEYLQHNTYT